MAGGYRHRGDRVLTWTEFVEIAKESLRFLVEEFGFRCTSEQPPFLVYASEGVQISFFYDVNGHGELDVGLERRSEAGKGKRFFEINQFKNLRGMRFPEPSVSPFVRTADDARRELSGLATQLRLYCRPVLSGDLTDFSSLESRERETKRGPH
jgi:hypothetical protein